MGRKSSKDLKNRIFTRSPSILQPFTVHQFERFAYFFTKGKKETISSEWLFQHFPTTFCFITIFLCSFFRTSGNLSWEGVEVRKYWQKMKQLQPDMVPEQHRWGEIFRTLNVGKCFPGLLISQVLLRGNKVRVCLLGKKAKMRGKRYWEKSSFYLNGHPTDLWQMCTCTNSNVRITVMYMHVFKGIYQYRQY